MWSSWASFVYMEKPERFARYAQRVWSIDKGGVLETAKAGIERTVEYFKSLDMPVRFSDLDVGVQDDGVLRELADRCVFYGKRTIGKFKVLDRDAVYQIYRAANH
jgi:hypothetical protein